MGAYLVIVVKSQYLFADVTNLDTGHHIQS